MSLTSLVPSMKLKVTTSVFVQCCMWSLRKRQETVGGASQRDLQWRSLVEVLGEFTASASSEEMQNSCTSGRKYAIRNMQSPTQHLICRTPPKAALCISSGLQNSPQMKWNMDFDQKRSPGELFSIADASSLVVLR